MAAIRDLLNDRRASAVARFGLLAGVIALCSIAGTQYLSVATRDGGSTLMAMFRPAPRSPGIDYAPTASIRGQAGQTVLDPCTGKPK